MHTKLWNKDFILMLQGNAVSAIGDILYSVAIGYWVYGILGDIFPLTVVFIGGNLLSILPMAYLCFHKKTREFILTH